jgi:1,4-dihydroxy-2-naphthoate octaprenyltransferase
VKAPSTPSPLIQFIRLSRPLFLLGGFLFYWLGAGIAHYLGTPINWRVFLLGQACVTLLQLSAHYLNEYFDVDVDRDNPNRTPFTGGSGMLQEGRLARWVALLAAAATLTAEAMVTALMIRDGYLNQAAIVILIIAFLAAIFYSTPPLRLMTTGYGELTTSILVANLTPAFAFILQTGGDIHRLVAMSTFPLTALALAMLLAFSLPDYATDIKHDKRNLLVRLGWQRGMNLHNLLILLAYVLLAIATLMGMPWRVIWPAFLTLPLGLLQIWQMMRIANGARPNWRALTFMALALLSVSAYLLTLAYWTA